MSRQASAWFSLPLPLGLGVPLCLRMEPEHLEAAVPSGAFGLFSPHADFSVWIHIWGLPPGYHHLYVGTDSALDLRFSPWWEYILLCFSFRCPSISLSLPLKHSRKRSSFLQVVLVLLSHKSVNPPSPASWLSCEHFLHKVPSEATSGGFCIREPPAFN